MSSKFEKIARYGAALLIIAALAAAIWVTITNDVYCGEFGTGCMFLGEWRSFGGIAALAGLLLLVLFRGSEGGVATGVALVALGVVAAVGMSPEFRFTVVERSIDGGSSLFASRGSPRQFAMDKAKPLELDENLEFSGEILIPSNGQDAGFVARTFNLPEGGFLRFETKHPSDASKIVNPKIALYRIEEDGTRPKVGEDDDSGNDGNAFLQLSLTPGQYAILIEGVNVDPIEGLEAKIQLEITNQSPSYIIPDAQKFTISRGEEIKCDFEAELSTPSSCRRIKGVTGSNLTGASENFYLFDVDAAGQNSCLRLTVQTDYKGARVVYMLDGNYDVLGSAILYDDQEGDLSVTQKVSDAAYIGEIIGRESGMAFDLTAELRVPDERGECLSDENLRTPVGQDTQP